MPFLLTLSTKPFPASIPRQYSLIMRIVELYTVVSCLVFSHSTTVKQVNPSIYSSWAIYFVGSRM